MRYVLLMRGAPDHWRAMDNWPAEDTKRHLAFLKDVDRQLTATGELLWEEILEPPERAKVVRAQPDGSPVVAKAAAPGAREPVLGCWLLDCDAPERAIHVAAQISATPGRGGQPLCLPVEVRPVMCAPGEEM
ncbi:MAG TPA: hypothetical protein VGG33_10675 [Polyangia bacterium]